MRKGLTFSDAIEKVMIENGYYAPLQLIYKEFEKHRPFSGLTPLKTIQERVQRDKRFTRIGFGVYALTRYLDRLPRITEPRTNAQKAMHKHTEIQGMVIEIGNMKGFDTYTPDKSKIFANKRLGNLVTLKKFPEFTYPRIIRAVKFLDVVWFNQRGFPERIFEVEDSTDFRGSFVKFVELQDFRTLFYMVASEEKKAKYQREVSKSAFQTIADRCHFIAYSDIERYYESSLNYRNLSQLLEL